VLLSVIIPTHQPSRNRLERVIGALSNQSFSVGSWELVVVDNDSEPPLRIEELRGNTGMAITLVKENRLGLTPARIRGIREAGGEVVVFVDDDNVLDSNYLSMVVSRFAENRNLGACGGKALPEFEITPPDWTREFWHMLAVRDLGPEPLRAGGTGSYPECAPIGAGMAVRRQLALNWATEIENDPMRMGLDRSGKSLASGGDNDLVLTVLKQGFDVEYVPELVLTHLVSARRTTTSYLARLNYASSRTWVRLLRVHNVPTGWTPISWTGAAARKARAFFRLRPWRAGPEYIRWRGACGIFDGRAMR